MKMRRGLLIAGFVGSLGLGFVAGPGAQLPWSPGQAKVVWRWPDSMDAPNAAPKNHKVLFENDHVLLLEVTIQPGEQEKLHGHKWPSVFLFDAPQPKLVDHIAEDNSNHPVPNREFENVDWYAPQCVTMGPQAPHQVTITDTFPQHFYRLEFKKMDGKSIEAMTHYPPK
jgi:hypothetical protein